MKYDPRKHHRRSIRLKGYDYSRAGAYFVTLVAQGRESLFGQIARDEIALNAPGAMIRATWEELPARFPNIESPVFEIMPNHFHAIVVIHENVGATLVVAPGKADSSRAGKSPAPTGPAQTGPTPIGPSLGAIIGAFKSITTHRYILGVRNLGWTPFDRRLWQRNYYEHVIRGSGEFNRIWRYIESNPANWSKDDQNPAGLAF